MSSNPTIWRVIVTAVAAVVIAVPGAALPASAADPTPTATGTPTPTGTPTGPTPVGRVATTQATAGTRVRPPRTNLQAVVDPIAVKVHDGVRIRVGMRNAGPRSITAPVGYPATSFRLYIVTSMFGGGQSLSGCHYEPETPPHGDPPVVDIPVAYFMCDSGRTLRTGETYWQSFVFRDLRAFDHGNITISGDGYADDPVERDNTRTVVVRLGSGGGGPGLPVTGTSLKPLLGGGLAVILVGTLAFLLARRHRIRFTAG
jgi:hypothetical protein